MLTQPLIHTKEDLLDGLKLIFLYESWVKLLIQELAQNLMSQSSNKDAWNDNLMLGKK